jgi:ABC-type nickel/cobalt efflux system permease component RcnA
MSMKSLNKTKRIYLTVLATLLAIALTGDAHATWAQLGAFGSPRPVAIGGLAGWVLAEQAMFYRTLASTIRLAKTDGSALWALMGISFIYGVFHAAGPGHGKAVISSYLLANEETWRRGITLSFASAVMQSFTAVTIVGIAAVLLGATAKLMGDTVRVIEIVSYGLIVLLSARLLWVKGHGFLGAVRELKTGYANKTVKMESDGHFNTLTSTTYITVITSTVLLTSTCKRSSKTQSARRKRTTIDVAATTITKSRWMYCHGGMPMAPSLRNYRDRAGGGAACRLYWPSVCGPVPARSSCSYSH